MTTKQQQASRGLRQGQESESGQESGSGQEPESGQESELGRESVLALKEKPRAHNSGFRP